MDFIIGVLMFWALGAVFNLPWVLVRLGIYKRWYLAPSLPPIIWGNAVFAMVPASTFFWFIPLLAFGGIFVTIVTYIGFIGLITGPIIAIWTPRWAKPKWQQYLEDTYTKAEIRRYIPIWRKMPHRQWNSLLDSEAGIDELVALARAELEEASPTTPAL